MKRCYVQSNVRGKRTPYNSTEKRLVEFTHFSIVWIILKPGQRTQLLWKSRSWNKERFLVFLFFEHPNRVQPWDFSVLCMLSVPRVASLPRVVSPEGVSVLRVVSREGCQTRGVSVPRVVSPNDWALMYPGAFDSVASLSSQIRGFVSLKISSVNTRSFWSTYSEKVIMKCQADRRKRWSLEEYWEFTFLCTLVFYGGISFQGYVDGSKDEELTSCLPYRGPWDVSQFFFRCTKE